MFPAAERTGSIHDLGYRHYDGPRLGRRHAILSVYLHSLRTVFGLGRRASSKIVPFALAVIVLIPAVVHLGIAAASAATVDVIRPENYYSFVEIVLALFVAAVAPELLGRDQRDHTLSLYFSRALRRGDYALAKLAALTTAMLLLTILPQAVLLAGNAFATDSSWDYLRHHAADIPRILASAATVSAPPAAIALAIASYTPRRAYATGGAIAFFLVSLSAGGILAVTVGKYGVLVSPLSLMRGSTLWIFDAIPANREALTRIPGEQLFGVLVAQFLVAAGVLVQRYRRLSA